MDQKELDRLNKEFESAAPQDILRWAFKQFSPRIGLTSSFGGESAGLLHMATQIEPSVPVLFLNTGFLFQETLDFAAELKRKFNLNLREFKADAASIEAVKIKLNDPKNVAGQCCDDTKVGLMKQALEGMEAWIAGLRRNQASTRKNIKIIESYANGLVKVHPLANWTSKEIYAYMMEHKLPFHPLWHKGYTSIGCAPCTSLPLPGGDSRSGRWAGKDKTECGIHTFLSDKKS